MLHILDQRRN
uniref:Uncharacterized protein n=1 Tax=Lepeophtheirus salmonis TaxID=72036 RepID=A0A0K2UIX7_LEPSM